MFWTRARGEREKGGEWTPGKTQYHPSFTQFGIHSQTSSNAQAKMAKSYDEEENYTVHIKTA